MAAPQKSLLAVGLLLFFFLCCSSSSLPCPQSCTCQRVPLLNCSSSYLSSVPRLTEDSVAELDLSHNFLSSVKLHHPHRNLRNVWLGNNRITYLSLCIEGNPEDRYRRHRTRIGSRARCLPWAPALQLLSAERNLLEQLPEGLNGVKSLQILQLSFNKISTLHPGALSHLRQLKELHLQHNLLTHLHPQTFQDLDQLRILDLTFNMLTSLHPVTYLTLRSIGTDARLGGNRWHCDCSMFSLRRRMDYDSSRGLQIWNILCASPSTIAGRDLLQLKEDDSNCLNTENGTDLHKDVTVYSGSEILLSCSAQDSVWWTPMGQAAVNQNKGLLISNISESDTGLYVCLSEENQVVSVFNLQISKSGDARKPRSLPRVEPRLPQVNVKEMDRQVDLPLAVGLSVSITFLFAFVLGVLARPCIDVLWKRVTNKKRTSSASAVSPVEQRQYVNEAFSSAEEPEDPGLCRERRVTFSTVDFIEESNVQYYDTVASGDHESISSDEVFEGQVVETELYKQTTEGSRSEHLQLRFSEDNQSNGSYSGDSNEQHIHNMVFEHIPDPEEIEKRRSMSSCSDSDLSENVSGEEQITKRKNTKPDSYQLEKDSVQQRPNLSSKAEVTQVSIPLDSDVLHDNEELFEFSDSAHSPTSFINPKQTLILILDKQKIEDMSSSSSYISENEPKHYTVNSDLETEQDDLYGVQKQSVDPLKYSYNKKWPVKRPHCSFSSDSSKSDQEYMQNKRKQKNSKKKGITNLEEACQRTQVKDFSDVKAQILPRDFISSDESSNQDTKDIQNERKTSWTRVQVSQLTSPESSANSDTEDETGHMTQNKQELHMLRRSGKVSQSVTKESDNQWLALNHDQIVRIKRRLDIKGPRQKLDLSFSNDSEDENGHKKKWKQEELFVPRPPIKVSQTVTKGIKGPTPTPKSSSSSDSEDETSHINKQEQKELNVSRPPTKVPQTVTKEQDNKWPTINLGAITHLKRRLDIKGPTSKPDSSSSSDSEYETGHIKKQEQKELNVSWPPTKVSQTISKEQDNQWPTINFGAITHLKRRLDIKEPTPKSDLSYSSDCEDETDHIKKQEQEIHVSRPPIKVSQTVTKEQENPWPTINLGAITHPKRRLEIKGPTPKSSSSCDSEDETGHIKKQEQQELHVSRPPIKVSQTVTKEQNNQWPTINLGAITHLKRRLDIKGPSPTPESSSSSDSEDETSHINKQEQKELNVSRPPTKVPQIVTKEQDNKWPTINLGAITHLKRRLDIEVPTSKPDSSSSSDSEYETGHIKKQEQKELNVSRPPTKVSQTISKEQDNQWPTINFGAITHLKRRLDIKGPTPKSDSSSSSDSEDETGHIKKQEQEIHVSRPPIKVSQTVTKEQENPWPTINLGAITHPKRRLEIKGPTPESSSSSDSEDETGHVKKQEQQELHVSRPPIKVSQTVTKEQDNQWPTINLGAITHLKRRLDIKGPSQTPESSSSSDSEDETSHINKQEQKELNVSRPPTKVPQTVTKEQDNKWPTINLGAITHLKRRLDIKGPTSKPDSSSSSDSEYETGHVKKQEQKELNVSRPPTKVSQTISKEQDNQWPTINFGAITHLKRRLDIKGPTSKPDSSSSSDSEYETGHVKKQEQKELNVSRPPTKVSQTISKEQDNQWPTINFGAITHLKRRLDIKGPTPKSDSSSSSDSEDETSHINKQEQKELNVSRPPIKVSQTVTKEQDNKWPTINLGAITHPKRRLEIKGPTPESSSSSDSEDETGHVKKQEQQELHVSRPPIKVSQTVTKEQDNQWPTINLGAITHLKRRLDIKGPTPKSDSSSSSDSEDETSHINKQEQKELNVSRPPTKVPQTVTKEQDNKWPTINLGAITHLKRRLDIKGPTSKPDSSSSSDSEYETGHVKKQEQKELNVSRPPTKVSQTISKEQDNQWPTINFGAITHLKRRLDIKGPTSKPDSSSSSDSEYETGHVKKQEQKELNVSRPPTKVSQTISKEQDNQWPTINFGAITHLKRRLDIKGPTPKSDSSSSSDSEDETSHINKQEQKELNVSRPPIKVSQTVTKEQDNKWPTINLGAITHPKRRLEIKGPTPESSSSSDSEDETGHVKKQEQQELHVSRPPIKVSQTVTKEQDNQWPTINLGAITHLKRRLDIKGPTTKPDSSSSSDSEDETGHIKKHEQELHVSRPPIKVSQTVTKQQDNQWPTINLGAITHLKRHLDIKGPSPTTESSSSSDSEDETGHINKQEQQELHVSRIPIKVSQTVTKQQDNQWPTINLGAITHLKKRLDIKGPTPKTNQFSSSDSENENGHINKQEQQELHVSRPPIKVSQTVTKEQDNQWPTINLGAITRLKRHLDIKGLKPTPDSSSSSDSEDEIGHIKIQEQELHISRPSIKVSQTVIKEQDNQWPALNLDQVTQIKRRFDIKGPSLKCDSSSSSDSEDETGHINKQEQQELGVLRPPIKVSQTVTKEQDNQWPTINLGAITYLKRRMDIKGPTSKTDTSSSSYSEGETGHIKKQEQQELHVSKPSIKIYQTVTKEQDNQWPTINLGAITHLKRRLDIKGLKPTPDSSSSSDSEGETGLIKKQEQELHVLRPPLKVSQTVTKENDNQWPTINLEAATHLRPALNLGTITHLKRRLDFKRPIPRSESPTRNHSENKTGHNKKQENGDLHVSNLLEKVHQTATQEPENQWPAIVLEGVRKIKRRLDINGPLPRPNSSSSSDSEDKTGQNEGEDEATGQFKKQAQKKLHVSRPGMETSAVPTTSEKKFLWSPEVLKNISHTPKKKHNITLEKYAVISLDMENQLTNNTTSTTPEINAKFQTQLATRNFGISRFRRRLEITSPTTISHSLPSLPPPDSPYFSSSESVPGRLQRRVVGVQELVHTDSSRVPENILVNVSPTLKDPHNKFTFSVKADTSKPDTKLVDLSFQDIKRYQDIWFDEKVSATTFQCHPHSSSSSDNEDETIDSSVPDQSCSVPRIKRYLNIKAPSPEPCNTQTLFSKSEKDVTKYSEIQSRQTSTILETTGESLITKHSIIKSSSLPKNSFTPAGSSQTADNTFIAQTDSYNTYHSPKFGPSMSFDDIVQGKIRQSRSNTDVAILHDNKWTRVDHHVSHLSTSNPVGLKATLPSSQQASLAGPHSLPLEASSSSNIFDKMQDSVKLDETLMNKYSSLGSKGASPSSSNTFDLLGISPHKINEKSNTASEDKREKKGLDALKVMSMERRLWERSLSSDDYGLQDDTNFIYESENDTKISSKVPLKRLSSSSMEKKKDADLFLLYGVPRYKRHDIKPSMHESPPPVPETPLPDD